jgi:hypothetical protein
MTLRLDAFDASSKKKSNTKYKAALGVGSVVSLFGIGSTLAANISLNGGGNVEFGQGVATTAACDEDGFTITPVTRFDNSDEIFKVDYVQVSGVNLTAEGTGWNDGDLIDLNFTSQADAKEAFPGQYYDGNEWKKTCDGVVLDFKAYTDDVLFLDRTVIGEPGSGEGSLQDPIGWYQDPSSEKYNLAPGFALVVDITDEGNFSSNYAGKNWAVAPADDGTDDSWTMGFENVELGDDPEQSSFQFYVGGSYNDTNAASISKITVQSMKTFPSSYYADREGLGNPENWYWDLSSEQGL